MIRISIILLALLCSAAPLSIACEVNATQGLRSNFSYNNAQYKTFLPMSELTGSIEFDIEKSTPPKDLSQIVGVAKASANKVNNEARWDVESVSLYKYVTGNCRYWYYQVNLRADNSYMTLNIGLNGQAPKIYVINEVLINGG